jgi:soluble lytic murein transglycosylase-like protein
MQASNLTQNLNSSSETAGARRDSFPFQSRLVRWGRIAALVCAFGFALSSGREAQAAQDDGRDAFLRAIAEVETGNNPRKVGRSGERGLYQFRQNTWRQHTRRPFYDAHSPAVAHDVATRHYEWILQSLQRNGQRPTPYMIAAAWNSGVSRVSSGRIPASTRDYAQRVVNLASMWSPAIRSAQITGAAPRVASN